VKEHAHYVVDSVKNAVEHVVTYNSKQNKNTTHSL